MYAFFFNDTATTEIYTLSLHDALPISSRATAQRAFLHNLARGEAYAQEAPTLWDVTFRTAVAQAELEDRERPGAYHRISFHTADGPVFIETTRPELIPARSEERRVGKECRSRWSPY